MATNLEGTETNGKKAETNGKKAESSETNGKKAQSSETNSNPGGPKTDTKSDQFLHDQTRNLFEVQPTYFKKSDFDGSVHAGETFMFGSATSAFQIEGGRARDRLDSIWDVFAEKRGFFEKYGEDAVNHWKHFKDDVKIMKEIGFNAYRFSISWSRICPSGKKTLISQRGIDFYRNLLTELKDNGITPFVTLFHWDTPAALQTKEYPGFLDRRIA